MPDMRRTRKNASSRGTGRSAASRSSQRPAGGRRQRGSAPAAHHRPARRAQTGAPQRIATSTLVLCAAVLLALVALVPIVNTYVSQQQELSSLNSQVVEEQTRVKELNAQIARWEDPKFVAAQARERLLFAMPGETQYRLTDSSGKEVPAPAAEREKQASEQPSWFGSMWDSLVASSQASSPADSTVSPQERGSR